MFDTLTKVGNTLSWGAVLVLAVLAANEVAVPGHGKGLVQPKVLLALINNAGNIPKLIGEQYASPDTFRYVPSSPEPLVKPVEFANE
jgi:hypothetical protein